MKRWLYWMHLAGLVAAFAYSFVTAFLEQPIEPLTPAPERSPRVHCVTTISCVEVPEDGGEWR